MYKSIIKEYMNYKSINSQELSNYTGMKLIRLTNAHILNIL